MKNISEKDLYVFIFSPDELSDSKFEEISNNKESFKKQLDILINMKRYLASFDSDRTSKKIFKRIKEIEKGSSILLNEFLAGKEMDYFIYKSKSEA